MNKMCDGTVEDVRDATGIRKADSVHELTLRQSEQAFTGKIAGDEQPLERPPDQNSIQGDLEC